MKCIGPATEFAVTVYNICYHDLFQNKRFDFDSVPFLLMPKNTKNEIVYLD